jgi:CheY-like chemotaxis protein
MRRQSTRSPHKPGIHFAPSAVALADPDPAGARAVASLLESWGYELSWAPSLRGAVLGLLARELQPDLALVDAGHDPARRATHARAELRELGWPDLPCVLLLSRDVEQPMVGAAAPWLHKPIAPARLRTALIRLVRPTRTRSGRSPAPHTRPA